MSETNRRGDTSAIVFALLLPTVVTWVYFVALSAWPAAIQQTAYAAGKTLQFAFPLIWVLLVRREKLQLKRPNANGVAIGLVFGVAIVVAMLVLYHAWLQPAGFFDQPAQAVRQKIADLGLSSKWRYAALAVFYALGHSLLEEYYWRWFVFGQMRRLWPFGVAVSVSSLGFMAHHVILLATYFGWQSPATYLLSLSVAVGGAAWAWMYERTGSLYGPWLSHLLVDAGIFIVGYEMVGDMLT
jgi:membrane protease YdiL (CAAX protease family)